ncbi:MAG: RES family NAD+ phosphorylase [Lentimicrobium sp.]
MKVFRLSRSKFAGDLSGKGAEIASGRWNSKGTAMLYTSQSVALCTVELAVHTPLGNIPSDYTLITIEIPESIKAAELSEGELPPDWKTLPHANSTQLMGDEFVRSGKNALLKVPSVVVPGEYNFLINPSNPDSKGICIESTEAFEFNSRLFVR